MRPSPYALRGEYSVEAMAHHRFHPTIMREYDIRGVVGETLFATDAEALGRVFGTLIREAGGKSCCVGFDGRLSSPELESALVRGLVGAGATVHRVGCGPTPMLYYATQVAKVEGGIMVTGSHNPPDHNGFKMVLGGRPFFAQQIQDIGQIAATGRPMSRPGGQVIEAPIRRDYVARIARDYDGLRPLDVVWDAGNGASGQVMIELAALLPGRHTLLNAEIDGRFPAHHPDPTEPKNLEQLIATVRRENAEVGIAFDGDGDRLGVVDAKGRIIWGDQILALLAEDVLSSSPGATILADVKASQTLFDRVEALGGRAIMCRTGHSIIKTRMAETGALLAGEMSGHIFFADRYYGYDDALYAAVRFLGLVARRPESLATRVDALPELFNTPEIRIPCPDDRKFELISEIRERQVGLNATMIDIDGVRVSTPDGWWLLRASNTQAALVARCESPTRDGLSRLQEILRDQLTQCASIGLPD
jgi:phosphomannomutase